MVRVATVWVWVAVLLFGGLMGQQESTMEERLKEVERRLEELEQRAQDEKSGQSSPMTVELGELRRQVDILAEEIERMRSGEEERELSPERASSLGLSPSASSVYRKEKGVSIAGYGEMLYSNSADSDQSGTPVDKVSTIDFLRAIFYAGYRFNDRFVFNSEIELEHASTDKSGSASVEFAYVEYLINQNLSARGGMLLIPMGFVNEYHEPNVFLGSLRPETERLIIPSTWRENGFGALGAFGPFSFRTYLVNGLDASGFTSTGFRSGRQKGSIAKAGDLAFVSRLDYAPTPGVVLGGSIYSGGSGQGQFFYEGRELKLNTTIWELHGQAQFRGWDFRGLLAGSHLGDAKEFNLLRGLPADSAVAERMAGGYLQAGYNVLAAHHESMGLTPYYRFESVNTQHHMPEGFFADPSRDRDFHTFGLEFKPIYNIVVKSDYQWSLNEKKTGLNQFNIGLGYSF